MNQDVIQEQDITSEPVGDSQPRAMSPGEAQHAEGDGWVVLSISLYPDDLRKVDEAVDRIKAAGARRMSRSRLIRIALSRLNIDKVLKDELKVR